ncbi:S41 family peptidase [Horticoccus luteus]|uniref:S41 family peptidase n=2 Tax=Horticoccus luteus TaxID=2862869 RepID=A0A8F9TZV8_9BACT|nr:S41 family peptidase [Horticoccus luteus]
MFKRVLTLVTGVLLGIAATVTIARVAAAWSFWPNRELDRSAGYVREVLALVNENYVDGKAASYDALAHSAIHGMVESLDPHSEFLESSDYQELEEELTGDFSGIGVQVEKVKDRFVVVAPIAGTPGDRAGITRGDEILGVDGKLLSRDDTMETMVQRLRGKKNTKVKLSLFRPSTRAQIDLTLTREVIKVASVRDVHLLPGGAGYLQLTEFSERTADDFDAALDKLLALGADSLIIDLRNNPGGLLDAAVDVAEPFFSNNELIVYTKGRQASDREEFRASVRGEPLRIPTVVLINEGTASAAEIVTGALKDTGKAVIVGERSFGKGSVQSVFKLKNGEGLRLTTAKYYTPSGVSIHEKGITPQVEVVMSAADDRKLRLQQLRSDVTDPKTFQERFGFAPIEDRPLEVAREVLRAARLLDERAAEESAPAVAGQ